MRSDSLTTEQRRTLGTARSGRLYAGRHRPTVQACRNLAAKGYVVEVTPLIYELTDDGRRVVGEKAK